MKHLIFPVLLVSSLFLSSCGEQAPVEEVVEAPKVVVAPSDPADDRAWEMYAAEMVKRNMQGVSERTFNYYLPGRDADDYEGQYQRQLETVQGVLYRTVLPGNMLTFVSPDSEKMADMVVEAAALAPVDALKGVRVLFIGRASDNERVAEALAHTNADYVFVSVD